MDKNPFQCSMCGACCIELSISSPIPGLPDGKPAGVCCIHLTADNRCAVYSARPEVCRNWRPDAELCGSGFEEASRSLALLEEATR